MKKIGIIIFSVFTLVGCNAQEKEQTKIAEQAVEPKVDYKVNKEYDEDGNLIEYDSVYTYYYSNIDKDAMLKDSIFKKFNEHLELNNPIENSLFDDILKEDDFIEDDFFKEDFFRGNSDRNQEIMFQMMQKMDSLKNQFFVEQFPLKEKSN